MKVYVVVCEHIHTRFKSVSQEGYTSLEKAQEFCLNRSGNVSKITEYIFVDEKHVNGYEIVEITVI